MCWLKRRARGHSRVAWLEISLYIEQHSKGDPYNNQLRSTAEGEIGILETAGTNDHDEARRTKT